MKVNQLIIITLVIVTIILVITGCEYDGPTAMYYQDHAPIVSPVINSVEPANRAAAGVNYITIIGENFLPDTADYGVYVSGFKPDIVEFNETSIRFRRPNVTGDSLIIKVNNYNPPSLLVGESDPYIIDPVYEDFGGFIANNPLAALTVDNEENLYVVQRSDSGLFRITSAGEKTFITQVGGTTYDVKIRPDGRLLTLSGTTTITQVNLSDGTETVWATLNEDEEFSYGDFDSNDNFYTAGNESGLFLIPAGDTTGSLIDSMYRDERCDILDIKVYDGYLYLLCDFHRTSDMINGIYRHQILSADGSIGSYEIVLLNNAEIFAEGDPVTFAFSESGIIYIGTDSDYDPIVSYNIASGELDVFYKAILPVAARFMDWGTENYLYMIYGGDNWNVAKIDMGTKGAPYYGRE